MKKNSIILLLLVIICMVGIGCSNGAKTAINTNKKNQSNEVTTANINKQANEIINVHVNMDLIKSYNTIASLKKNSEIMVQGSIIDATSYISGPGVITEYKLKVLKSYNNTAKIGDVVTIATGGGIVSYEEFLKIDNNKDTIKNFEKDLPKENLINAKVKMTLGDNDLMEIGKEYLIFANTQQIKNKKMYCVINSYEGQFEVINNKVINKALNYNKSIENLDQEIKQ